MKIASIRDKRLRRFIERDDGVGLPPQIRPKLNTMLTVLSGLANEAELASFPHWRAHKLSGDLAGYWSLTITRNWRLIFKVEDNGIRDLDLIDYH